MARTIIEVLNSTYEDGLNLRVTLDAAPSGTLRFFASPVPGSPTTLSAVNGNAKPHTVLSATTFQVQVRNGVMDPGVPGNEPPALHRMPYYLCAKDSSGVSAEELEWLCAGANTGWMRQVDELLQDILVANLGALDRAMQLILGANTWPSGRPVAVRQLHIGPVQSGPENTFPRISHQCYSVLEDHLGAGGIGAPGLPYSDYVPLRSELQCYSLYQPNVPWGFVLKELGMAVFNVLNQPHYLENTLPCGLKLFQCMCSGGTLQEYYDQALEAMVVGFTLQWSGNLHAAKYDPNLY